MKESSILSFLARRGSLISSENSPPRLPRRVFVLFRLGFSLPPSLSLSAPVSFPLRLSVVAGFCLGARIDFWGQLRFVAGVVKL